MAKPFDDWTVLPHGKLCEIDKNILTVVGEIPMPLMTLRRRMTVARLHDSRLVVFSAIALDEEEMQRLERYGRPAFLVVPNDHHRLDAKPWKQRYPQMQVVTPEGARGKVEDVVHVDTSNPEFNDPHVHFVTVPGTGSREAALVISNDTGTTLVLNDLVGNIRKASGFGGLVLRLMKFAGKKPHIPNPVKWNFINDKHLLRLQLLRWADLQALKRILVSHGSPIEDHPGETLQELAGSLG